PAMPFEDPDHDGLTNLQEFQNGTDPHNPDTDSDGLTDGQEVLLYHTSPLFVDSDGDGVPDGVEVKTGTNPLDPTSFNYALALSSPQTPPAIFVPNQTVFQPNVSLQLKVTGLFIVPSLTADLTSRQRGTTYATSDPMICNFGIADGLVFAGNAGSCTITASVG